MGYGTLPDDDESDDGDECEECDEWSSQGKEGEEEEMEAEVRGDGKAGGAEAGFDAGAQSPASPCPRGAFFSASSAGLSAPFEGSGAPVVCPAPTGSGWHRSPACPTPRRSPRLQEQAQQQGKLLVNGNARQPQVQVVQVKGETGEEEWKGSVVQEGEEQKEVGVRTRSAAARAHASASTMAGKAAVLRAVESERRQGRARMLCGDTGVHGRRGRDWTDLFWCLGAVFLVTWCLTWHVLGGLQTWIRLFHDKCSGVYSDRTITDEGLVVPHVWGTPQPGSSSRVEPDVHLPPVVKLSGFLLNAWRLVYRRITRRCLDNEGGEGRF